MKLIICNTQESLDALARAISDKFYHIWSFCIVARLSRKGIARNGEW